MSLLGSDEAHIRDFLASSGHRKWGFVIYRCTYKNEDAWLEFLEIANKRVEQDLTASDCPELRDSFGLKVFNDLEFDGASKDRVRNHFIRWCSSEDAKMEQYDLNNLEDPAPDSMLGSSPRYLYPIHVDDAALQSITNNAPKPPARDVFGIGFVNLIDASWSIPDPATFDYEANGLDRETYDPTDQGEDPIEGCRMYEVGWMRMGMQTMGVSGWAVLRKSSMFNVFYHRPPAVWVR